MAVSTFQGLTDEIEEKGFLSIKLPDNKIVLLETLEKENNKHNSEMDHVLIKMKELGERSKFLNRKIKIGKYEFWDVVKKCLTRDELEVYKKYVMSEYDSNNKCVIIRKNSKKNPIQGLFDLLDNMKNGGNFDDENEQF